MRYSDLIEAVENLVTAFKKSRFDSLPRGADITAIQQGVVSSLHTYIRLAAGFGPIERAVLKIWGLDEVDSVETMQGLIAQKAEAVVVSVAHKMWLTPSFAYLLTTLQLLAHEVPKVEGRTTLTLILPAEKRAKSKLARYVSALSAIQALYTVCARIHVEEQDTLSLVSCDSGSDVYLVLFGLAVVVRAVDRLLTNIYHTWAFYRHAGEAADIEHVFDKLAVYEEIDKLEKKNKIGPEEAGQLRHDLKCAAPAVVEAGVITSNIEQESHGDARQLMAPAPKLLLGPPAGVAGSSEVVEEAKTPEIASLTPEETQLLEKLLRKVRAHPEVADEPSHSPDLPPHDHDISSEGGGPNDAGKQSDQDS